VRQRDATTAQSWRFIYRDLASVAKETEMAKSQLRSNREPKKPKQAKAKPMPTPVLNWVAPKAPLPSRARAKK
jgi:hypothetical protein